MWNEREDVEAQSRSRLVTRNEPRRNQDSPRLEVDLSDAGLDKREQQPAVELERVVRRTGLHVGDDAEPPPPLLDDLEADELEDVVRPGLRRRQLITRDLEPGSPRHRTVEPDHEASAGALLLLDSHLLA